MQIVSLKIEDLNPYKNNPRINDEAVRYVASSIKEFGFKVPVIVDENYVIVAGHTRVKAAKQLGIKEVPCIIADDLTPEQIKAFRLADNRVAEIAEWDVELLQAELQDLKLDFDMFDFGFNEDDESDEEVEEDNYDPEVPQKPKSKYGQVYQLGKHRLMCGDSTLENDVKKLAGGVLMDLCITDPPYNVNYTQAKNDGEELVQIMNDNMEDGQFFHFLLDAFVQMFEVLKPGGGYYIWHADSEGFNFRAAIKAAGGTLRQTLIWVKNSLVLGRQDYQWQHEPCLYGWKDGAGHYFTSERSHTTVYDENIKLSELKKDELYDLCKRLLGAYETTVIREDKPKRNDLHPTMKPIKLMGFLIKNSSKINDKILDLFGGSGSTLIAAEQLGRACYMMELDPGYVDVIIDRWQELTGETAVLLDE